MTAPETAGPEQQPDTGTKPKKQPKPKRAPRPPPAAPTGCGPLPLGHDRGLYYYLNRGTRQIVALTPSQHTKLNLVGLASVEYHWERAGFAKEGGGVAWDSAANALMRMCEQIGIFDPLRTRGRGAWRDKGRSVLHLGDRLLVDGAEKPLMLEGSRFVYEAAPTLVRAEGEEFLAPPLSAVLAHKVLAACRKIKWDNPIMGRLLAGWIVAATICGALKWRPSLWITAPSGGGKGFVLEQIIKPLLSGIAVYVQSNTTEAGIRQTLGCDALPVVFDEAETEDNSSRFRMQTVLSLVRQSSSESGAEILKGTQNQTGAKKYRIRSCFLFSSISVSLDHYADLTRITVLSLSKHAAGEKQENEEFDAYRKECLELANELSEPGFAAGLITRTVKLLPVILANAETFAQVIALDIGSRRIGDQIGTLLAGAYSLCNNGEISPAEAKLWLGKNSDWKALTALNVDPDERRLLRTLMQRRVRVQTNVKNGTMVERTLGELVFAAENGDAFDVSKNEAMAELKRNGIIYASYLESHKKSEDGSWEKHTVDTRGIFIANTHPAFGRLLADTPWSGSGNLSILLRRLPKTETKLGQNGQWIPCKFSAGFTQRATWVPTSVVFETGSTGVTDEPEEPHKTDAAGNEEPHKTDAAGNVIRPTFRT